MDKFLELKINVGGGAESTPFPNSDNPIVIGAFRYDAKRMGGAPTITASVNYPSCLDDEWTDNVYAEFNGEKYYLKQTPTSSYDNADTMYKHDITLVSERVALDNVYFFDVVTGNPMDSDKPVSNSTKVVFFGGVREFARRMNASLEYSKLLKWEDGVDEEGNPIKVANGYNIVVDNDEAITTEEKLMSFEDQFFSNVLQEIYKTYEVPYYFDGKTIHIGYSKEGVVIPDLAYGVDNALLSITKNNANYKIVNRATGTGSSDNIPFYYPNNSPKGEIAATPSSNFEVKILDAELYSNEIKLDGVIRKSNVEYENAKATFGSEEIYSGETFSAQMGAGGINKMFGIEFTSKDAGIFLFSFSSSVTKYILKEEEKTDATFGIRYFVTVYDRTAKKRTYDSKGSLSSIEDFEVRVPYANHKYEITIECYYAAEGKYAGKGGRIAFNASYSFGSKSGWMYEEKVVDLKDVGLEVVGNTVTGDTITQTLVKYVNTSKFLMPFKYRETDGKERFYNATNDTYEGVTFNNPFVEGKPKEHIIKVDDIKPSIEGMEYKGQRIDMFEAFAYDDDDNDETYEDEKGNVYFKHPYFFAKLKPLGFNLFDHAIEQQPMVISFTSGDCGACNFEIAVDEETQKNAVQVDEGGNVKRDEDGNVLCGSEALNQSIADFQPSQQDTTDHSVWIALRKEEDTYGILMPKAPTKDEQGNEIGGHRPKGEKNADGTLNEKPDTFVILGINLPYEYIEEAEKKLEAEIIKYLKENNDEKFTFSIGFSRIFFEENATVLNQLSENSKIRIIYDEKPYDLYVSSFSYNMAEGDALPEIRVELDETLKVSQNALQNAISQVKSELGRALGNIDVLGAATPYFIRKDADDEARGKINFTKGIKFGEGGKVEVLDNNSAKLTIEYLEVTKKASFTSLEIQEKTHVGGQILVTPAAINCGEVEELEDVYRCYFQTKGTDGDEIFNQFAVGDQAICQTYNAWGSVYYWRLVTGIGEDYIDLSKTECDEESGVPKAGDKIIQLGNQIDPSRQNAIVIAAYGDGSPYIIQYKGINDFELPEDKIVTKLSSTENIFTGKVHMELGSDGFENLGGSLNIGKQNMLRNSGFTGDYLSEPLADQRVLDAADDLFSAPFDHWTKGENVTRAELPDDSMSGYGVQFPMEAEESLAQEMYYPVLNGEGYVLTFKAKGTSLTYSVGGVTKEVALTEEWAKYTEKITATTTSKDFVISSMGATICEIQLERGTIATAWGNSPWDNSSDRAYIQSIAYLAESMTKDAMVEGSTDVLGGLILTNHIKVGNYANQTMIKETGGISGLRNDDNDVAFWGGGDFASAMEAVSKFKDNPTYQPTEEELAGMANFVVTHGGRAILNDIILRGIVYATGGKFQGTIDVDAKDVNGRVTIGDDGFVYYTTDENGVERARVSLGSTCAGAGGVFLSRKANAYFCVDSALIAVGDDESEAIHAKGDSVFDGSVTVFDTLTTETMKIKEIIPSQGVDDEYFSIPRGSVRGIRTRTRVISAEGTYALSEYDFSIFVNRASGSISLTLPSATIDGQEYIVETRGAEITLTTTDKRIYSHEDNNSGLVFSLTKTNRGVFRLKYYREASTWTFSWVDKY